MKTNKESLIQRKNLLVDETGATIAKNKLTKRVLGQISNIGKCTLVGWVVLGCLVFSSTDCLAKVNSEMNWKQTWFTIEDISNQKLVMIAESIKKRLEGSRIGDNFLLKIPDYLVVDSEAYYINLTFKNRKNKQIVLWWESASTFFYGTNITRHVPETVTIIDSKGNMVSFDIKSNDYKLEKLPIESEIPEEIKELLAKLLKTDKDNIEYLEFKKDFEEEGEYSTIKLRVDDKEWSYNSVDYSSGGHSHITLQQRWVSSLLKEEIDMSYIEGLGTMKTHKKFAFDEENNVLKRIMIERDYMTGRNSDSRMVNFVYGEDYSEIESIQLMHADGLPDTIIPKETLYDEENSLILKEHLETQEEYLNL